jgi:hypothetical protein
VTDHNAGSNFVQDKVGIPGINAVSHGVDLAEFLLKKVGL